jgi:glucose-1-phosphate cytidylyltransferase
MQAVLLAGGYGTRIAEETGLIPKPMVQIGGKPILWHIMKIYSSYGINDFVICLGYKGYVIKEYFANYFLHNSDVTFDMRENTMNVHQRHAEPWNVTLIDTGENTLTAGRLRRVAQYLKPNEPFCFTYGDGLANIDLKAEIEFHKQHKKLVTICSVQPPGRYGSILTDERNEVIAFQEKPAGDGGWINGGFFIVNPEAIETIAGDQTSFEFTTLPALTERRQVAAFEHSGFWHAMDTLRDKMVLEEMWKSGNAPWKIWT